MKFLTLFILSAILFVGLTFAGKSFFGMDNGMMMGSVECVNHCINASTIPSVIPSVALVLFFVAIFFTSVFECAGWSRPSPTNSIAWRRRTEPIRLFLLSKNLSTVILRD